MPSDPEHGKIENRYITGYPSLAAFIASDPDKSTAIYRRFDRLSARNLLCLQSELVELEARQDHLDAAYRARSTKEQAGARDWKIAKERAESDEAPEEDRERVEIALEIRRKMKEYSQ